MARIELANLRKEWGGAVAVAAYRESLRQPMFWLIFGLAALLILASMVIPYFTLGDDYKLMKQVGAPAQAQRANAITQSTLNEFRQSLRDHNPASAVGYVHSLMEMMRMQRELGESALEQAHLQTMIREMLTALAIWLIFGPWKRPGTASMSGTRRRLCCRRWKRLSRVRAGKSH